MIEGGIPDFVSMSFAGLMAPTSTPGEIMRRLNQELTAGLRAGNHRVAGQAGGQSAAGSPEEFAAFLACETEKWTAVAKRAGIRVE
jgi:tripartite-type tricarboxylate transporter receptor subunit TctC